MLVVGPIPSEGKGGCVGPHHRRSRPGNVYKWFLSLRECAKAGGSPNPFDGERLLDVTGRKEIRR